MDKVILTIIMITILSLLFIKCVLEILIKELRK